MRKLNDLERAILSMCISQQRRLDPALEAAGMSEAEKAQAIELKAEINLGVKALNHLEQTNEKQTIDKELLRLRENIRAFQNLLGLMKETK